MKGKGIQFLTIILTLFALYFANDYLLSNFMMSLVSSIAGTDESFAITLIAFLLSDLLVGIIACVPMYFQIREDRESHRRLLKYFEDKEFNNANLQKFLRSYLINLLIFALCMNLTLCFRYDLSLGSLILYPMSAIVIFTPYLILELVVRPRIFAKWYNERLHK